MPSHAEQVELDQLIRRLKKLAAKFPQEGEAGGARSNKEDGFEELEASFLRRVANANEMLKKTQASDTTSTTDAIRQRSNLHSEVTGISDTVNKMTKQVMQERKQHARGKGKLPDAERVRRETNLVSYGTMLSNLQSGLQRGGAKNKSDGPMFHVPRTALTKEALISGAKTTGVAASAAARAGVGMEDNSGVGGNIQGMSGEQQQALREIYKVSDEHDQMIEEIGLIIQDIQDISRAMNDSLAVQDKMLRGVEVHIEKTQDNLETVNSKVKKMLETKGMSFERMCMVFICLVLIFALIGVIVSFTTK